MAKIKLTAELKDLDGAPIPQDVNIQRLIAYLAEVVPLLPKATRADFDKRFAAMRKPLTLWTALAQMAGAPLAELNAEERSRIYLTLSEWSAKKLKPIEASADTIVLLQRAVGVVYHSPVISGQVKKLLEGK